jgi:hypothetical protein
MSMAGNSRRLKSWLFTAGVAIISMIIGGMFAVTLTLILVGSDEENRNPGPAQLTE